MSPTVNGDITQICSDIASALPAGVVQLVGESQLLIGGAPPRIVWVPKSEGFSRAGGRHGMNGSPNNPRAIYERSVMLEAHIWGAALDQAGKPRTDATEAENIDATEALLVSLLCAIEQQAWSHAFRATGGKWESGSGAVDKLGYGYVLTCEFKASVPFVEGQTDITSFPTAASFDTTP